MPCGENPVSVLGQTPVPQITLLQVECPPQVSFRSCGGRWDIVTERLFPAEILWWWRRLEPRPVSGAGSVPLPSCKLLQNTKNTQNISQMLLVRASNCCNCHRDVI